MGRRSLSAIPKAIVILLSILMLFGPWGCAHGPKPVSEEMRAQFGKIGIVSAPSTPEIQFYPEFAKGRFLGASKGASMGSSAGALYGLSFIPPTGSCHGEACLAVAILAGTLATIGAVVGGVSGGVTGAANAVPKEEAQRIEDTVKNAFDGIIIQKAMAASVFKNSLELPDYNFILSGQDDFIISTPYDFDLLRAIGIDTVLEMNVKGTGFKEGRGKNPLIAFFMKVQTSLIRTKDGKEIYSREFEYKSLRHPSSDWIDMDARLTREEIDHCFNEFPKQIAEELFGKRSP